MRFDCFECESVIEADGPDAAADAFVAHAERDHEWTYPETALRTYARNIVEAIQRMTGGTERLDVLGEVVIHPVTEDRIDDWLDFFDHDGFADNPDWASCYCLEPHIPPPPEGEAPWTENRAKMVERLRGGGTAGYLAYVDGKAGGWVNASLRSTYGKHQLDEPGGPDPASVIGVSCFVIAPPYRRHGIAAALLDRVIADAPERGADWVEAYPKQTEAGATPADLFRGSQGMYEVRGFEQVAVAGGDLVVRRPVG